MTKKQLPQQKSASLTQLLDLTKVSDLELTMEGKASFPEENFAAEDLQMANNNSWKPAQYQLFFKKCAN